MARKISASEMFKYTCNCNGILSCDSRCSNSVLDCARKSRKLVSNPLAIKLIKIAFVAIRILMANLKIISFPPWSRNVDVALCSRYNKLSFSFYRTADFKRSHCIGKYIGSTSKRI